jgi:hypothetical protein
MKSKLLLLFFLIITLTCYSQDENWEPQKQVTGYFTFEGEYFNTLKYFNRDYALAMPEAGILFNYMPLSKLTFKGVFVYRPRCELRNMISEISAEYKIKDIFKIKVGHMLTPLSPVNTYFYAPVNTGIILPMIVSLHELYPISMEAVSINGVWGDNFKVDYNIFGGGYFNSITLPNGAMGFFGQEGNYFSAIQRGGSFSPDGYATDAVNSESLMYGTGIHTGFSLKDILQVGFNVFKANEKFSNILNDSTTMNMELNKTAFGINFKLKLKNFQISGERWGSNFAFGGMGIEHFKGAFIDISNSIGQFTPYARYEYSQSSKANITRYVIGLNFKPIYEITFKLEGFAYDIDNLKGITASAVYSF